MVALVPKVFTTEQVTSLLGLDVKKDKWRVVKFAESEEYGIRPSISAPSGSGSRRLYDLENVCEIALALRLLETGLRSKAIGRVIRKLRQQGKLSAKLNAANNDADKFLAIIRTPEPGKPLDKQRDMLVEWVGGADQAEAIWKKEPNRDLILVPLRPMFLELDQRLQQLKSKQVGKIS